MAAIALNFKKLLRKDECNFLLYFFEIILLELLAFSKLKLK